MSDARSPMGAWSGRNIMYMNEIRFLHLNIASIKIISDIQQVSRKLKILDVTTCMH